MTNLNENDQEEPIDAQNSYWNIDEKQLEELERVPKFKDAEKKMVNEDYIVMKVKYEKEWKNPNYRPKQQAEAPRIRGPYVGAMEKEVAKLGLTMHVEDTGIHILQLQIADPSSKEAKLLQEKFSTYYSSILAATA